MENKFQEIIQDIIRIFTQEKVFKLEFKRDFFVEIESIIKDPIWKNFYNEYNINNLNDDQKEIIEIFLNEYREHYFENNKRFELMSIEHSFAVSVAYSLYH